MVLLTEIDKLTQKAAYGVVLFGFDAAVALPHVVAPV
jgi:hypothetical protein